jgi:hypothetical protein
MARIARVEIFASDEVAIVHVMNRTVRRCFLMGDDHISRTNFDHRKVWIDEQLTHQARHFGIDLLCQAIMSNHVHLVLRSRPDVVREWSDTEIARRWLMLCPIRRDEHRQPAEPNEFELNSIVNDQERLAALRSRLSDISWWMRLFSQHIAQRANREDKETGKFWQARYRAVRLLDETALLACAAYVDLNPIRAAVAETIEGSLFTSAQKRACDLQASHGESADAAAPATGNTPDFGAPTGELSETSSSRHLAPVDLNERTGETGPHPNRQGIRCSDKGFLGMSTADYLSLLDWSARQQRTGKAGTTPTNLVPLFTRLQISEEVWSHLVQDFGRLFSVVAGKPHVIDQHTSRTKAHRYRVRSKVRAMLTTG